MSSATSFGNLKLLKEPLYNLSEHIFLCDASKR